MTRDPRMDFAWPATPRQRHDHDLALEEAARREAQAGPGLDPADTIARRLRAIWSDEAAVVDYLRSLPAFRRYAAGRAMRLGIHDERRAEVWNKAFPDGPTMSPGVPAPEPSAVKSTVADLADDARREALAGFLEGRVLSHRGVDHRHSPPLPRQESDILFAALLAHTPRDAAAAEQKLDARRLEPTSPTVAAELANMTRGLFSQHVELRRLHDSNPSLAAIHAGRAMAITPVLQQRAETIFRRAVSENHTEVASEDPRVKEALSRARGGQELPEAVRREMESRFGVSFAHVRVHADSTAAAAAQALHAEAFTVGAAPSCGVSIIVCAAVGSRVGAVMCRRGPSVTVPFV